MKISLIFYKLLFIIPVFILLLILFFSPFTSNIRNVSSLSSELGIRVYWDERCTNPVTEINWGTLSPGSKKQVTMFIKNEQSNAIYLTLNATNWNPQSVSRFMVLSWDYEGKAIVQGIVLKVNLVLYVSYATNGITNFSFDIAIGESLRKSPDLNHDGIVDMHDISLVARAFGCRYGQLKYDSNLDINNDGIIDMIDISTVARNFGRSSFY